MIEKKRNCSHHPLYEFHTQPSPCLFLSDSLLLTRSSVHLSPTQVKKRKTADEMALGQICSGYTVVVKKARRRWTTGLCWQKKAKIIIKVL